MSDWESDDGGDVPVIAPRPSFQKPSDSRATNDDSFGSSQGRGRGRNRNEGSSSTGLRNNTRSEGPRSDFYVQNGFASQRNNDRWSATGSNERRNRNEGSSFERGGRGMESSGFGIKCNNCGGIGHVKANCSSPAQPFVGNRSENNGFRPNSGGFRSENTGFRSNNGGFRSENDGFRSNNGGFKSHSNGFRSESDSFGSGPTCYNCNEAGHMRRECPLEESDGRPRKSTYFPEAVSAEKLLEENVSTGINFEKYDDLPIEVTGNGDIPTPIKSLDDCELRSQLQANLKTLRYTSLTPVQKQAIPIVLKGKDLMACAQTGSGKTAAFLLPILHKLLLDGVNPIPESGAQCPEALIIVPTRELAIQIKRESDKFAYNTMIKSQVAVGGHRVDATIGALRAGVNILVATPGRLIHFIDEGIISLAGIRFFVLDEADRMLDAQSMLDLDKVTKHTSMPSKDKRQNLMFSATFPDEAQRMAGTILSDYLFLKVGIVGAANSDVCQTIMNVRKYDKREKLLQILKDLEGQQRILIFVETKKNADFLGSYLSQEKFSATTIHGDREQREREQALRDFSRGKHAILVATEVAARGLDIPKVAHVINFDLPKGIDMYVHRIGRTGRVGHRGTATSFYDPEFDSNVAKDLVKVLSQSKQVVDDWLAKEANRSINGASGQGFGGYASTDIRRKKNNYANFYSSVPPEEDETWD